MPVIRHATVSLPALDVVAAAARMGGPLWAWSSPSAGEFWAAFGEAAVLTVDSVADSGRRLDQLAAWAPLDPEPPPGPWLASVAFDARRLWDGWPTGRFVLPRGIFWARGGRFHATALTVGEDGGPLSRHLAEMVAVTHQRKAGSAKPRPPGMRREEAPARDDGEHAAWTRLMERCLTHIGQGAVSKVVPARRMTLNLSSALDPVRLMEALQRNYPACQAYLFTGPSGDIFAGATPETLCRVVGNEAQVDALAGSAPLEHAAGLPGLAKERAEHAFVLDAVLKGLRPLSSQLECPDSPSVLRLPNIAHLHTPVRARLRDGVGPGAVLTALHPTPAVAGTPRDAAMDLLLAHEGFARGLYAGALGLVGNGDAHLCVALRCARIQGRLAELFVGAGVVQGSVAELEWEETARKSQPMQNALREATHAAA